MEKHAHLARDLDMVEVINVFIGNTKWKAWQFKY